MRIHTDRSTGVDLTLDCEGAEKDVAMLAYAEAIARDASKVTQADIDRLHAVGFTDQQICDIALCAAFHCLVSRFFDAVGAGPEAAFIDDDEAFRGPQTVGKSYAKAVAGAVPITP
jgi:alkylhydroperoxidase family enzyme